MAEPSRSGPGRVLLTGAAGRLGTFVARELGERGIPTTALVLPGPSGSPDEALFSAEPAVSPPQADRVIYGDARDPDTVGRALSDVDAVIHLAAIPSPEQDPAPVVFGVNTLATFAVLDAAGAAGIRRAAIASSYSVTGLPFAPAQLSPAYLPIDEDLPLQVTDAYALSKQVDEATAAMVWRRHRLSVVALRFPYLGDAETTLPARAAKMTADPAEGIREVWSYLDLRDAARVCVDALGVEQPGCHVIGLAAPTTLCPYPTEALLDAYLPHVPRRAPFPGRTVPIDVSRARALIGFTARHILPVGDDRDLPPR